MVPISGHAVVLASAVPDGSIQQVQEADLPGSGDIDVSINGRHLLYVLPQ